MRRSSALALAEVINYGTITTGDGKIGASRRYANSGFGYAARVHPERRGRHHDGRPFDRRARPRQPTSRCFANEGEISVGDDSVGVDITAGDVFAVRR